MPGLPGAGIDFTPTSYSTRVKIFLNLFVFNNKLCKLPHQSRSVQFKPGTVVAPTDGKAVKPGRVAVLLEGVAAPISFKLMNLRA